MEQLPATNPLAYRAGKFAVVTLIAGAALLYTQPLAMFTPEGAPRRWSFTPADDEAHATTPVPWYLWALAVGAGSVLL